MASVPPTEAELQEACSRADLSVIAAWTASCPVDAALQPEGLTPLALVARAADPLALAAVEHLLAAGARPDQPTGRGATPFHFALATVPEGQTVLPPHRVSLLSRLQTACMDRGNPWPLNSHGWNPLHCAVLRDSGGLIELLVRLGAPLDATDQEGNTALHVAYKGAYMQSVHRLQQFWQGPVPKNAKGQTPLECLLASPRGRKMTRAQQDQFRLIAALPPVPLAPAAPRRRL